MSHGYLLLDSGNRKKIEKFGDYILIRPQQQAIWKPFKPEIWSNFDSEFIRVKGEKGIWKGKTIPKDYYILSPAKVWMKVELNDFGNVGIFSDHWTYASSLKNFFDKNELILNLFSYSGSSVLPLLKEGFKSVAVDSSKSAMNLYSCNLKKNNINRDGQKLVLEDALKFCRREIRREKNYGSIMVDMPSFGRGIKGEVFDIDKQFFEVLQICKSLLKPKGKIVLTFHSPRYTLEGLKIILGQIFPSKMLEVKEILNPCVSGVKLPNGILTKIW